KHVEAVTNAAFQDPTGEGFPLGTEGRILFWIAVAFSAWQIATAAHLISVPSQVLRASHVAFLLLLVFPLVAAARGVSPAGKALAWFLSAAGAAVAVYQYVEYAPLILRAGDLNSVDITMGVVALATIFAAAWVMMGPALPIISGS